MYAYVKYVQDNAPNIVPVRLIKNFTLPGVMNKQYLVFWSKDRNQDEAFDRFIKKAKYDERLLVALDDPKREKNLSKFEGYYKAVVLKVSGNCIHFLNFLSIKKNLSSSSATGWENENVVKQL